MRFRNVLVSAALILAAFVVRPSAQAPAGGSFVPGEILVKFASRANANAKATVHLQAGGITLDEIARTGVQRISIGRGGELAAIARYLQNPNVLYAEPNYIRRIPALAAHSGGSEVVPGDRYFGEQWALHNIGQLFECIIPNWCFYQGTPDADIDAPEAWAVSTGSPVRVAVIDSGIDYNHPDLAMKYLGGYDFFNVDPDPMDDHGHGTHVSGTIAAAMNNVTGAPADEEGVVGVAPNALLLAYKVCGVDGSCHDFALQQAIARAVIDGAKVINMSLGGPEFSQSTYSAVQDAWNAGVVIVAGAGNNGTTSPFYPAAFDNVVSVAAFDEDHRRAPFSNYGTWVDISAPGNAIMSTYPMSACGTSTVPGDTGCYTWNSGTSMATPHVSGAAALIWSRPDVTTNVQVVDILLSSADRVGVSSIRLDSWTIHGGLNLHDALGAGSTQPIAFAGSDQTVMDSDGNGTELVTLDGSGSSDANGTIVSYEWFDGSTPIGTGATTSVALPVGTHTIVLEVTDDDDEFDTDSVVITVAPANRVTAAATTSQATEAGPSNGTVTISRTGSTSAALTVRYEVSGTAASGSDYLALSGTVTIDAGLSTAPITVTPVDDAIYESNEAVIVTVLSDPAYSLGSPSTATVTIVSDDSLPDLIVTVVSAPSTAAAGTAITVNSTVRNAGAGSAGASSTGFYLSTNTTIDSTDKFLGIRAVEELAPGAVSIGSGSLSIPPDTVAGSYFIIGRADWNRAVAESSDRNNDRASSVVRLGGDLVMAALASAPLATRANGTITVSDTTKNQGIEPVAASETAFYLSANPSFNSTDIFLGSRQVPSLAPTETNAASTELVIPSDTVPGSYYVIAVADRNGVVAESMETNNMRSASVRVGPDLTITALSPPSSAVAGTSITANHTTKNQGGDTAAASVTSFYLSRNTTLDANDVFLGTQDVASLAPSVSVPGLTTLVIPSSTPAGSYFLIAKADGNGSVAESLENNNTAARGISISTAP